MGGHDSSTGKMGHHCLSTWHLLPRLNHCLFGIQPVLLCAETGLKAFHDPCILYCIILHTCGSNCRLCTHQRPHHSSGLNLPLLLLRRRVVHIDRWRGPVVQCSRASSPHERHHQLYLWERKQSDLSQDSAMDLVQLVGNKLGHHHRPSVLHYPLYDDLQQSGLLALLGTLHKPGFPRHDHQVSMVLHHC